MPALQVLRSCTLGSQSVKNPHGRHFGHLPCAQEETPVGNTRPTVVRSTTGGTISWVRSLPRPDGVWPQRQVGGQREMCECPSHPPCADCSHHNDLWNQGERSPPEGPEKRPLSQGRLGGCNRARSAHRALCMTGPAGLAAPGTEAARQDRARHPRKTRRNLQRRVRVGE